jgi:PadR family transcriptional regulator PadR
MGTVEMLVLFLLDKKDLYGYEIVTLIRNISKGGLVIAESTLYPTLYKLMEKNYITDREEKVGKRRIRVYYHIEESGRSRLSDLLEDYRSTTIGIERVLSCNDLEEATNHE